MCVCMARALVGLERRYHHKLEQGADGKWRSISLHEEVAYNQAMVHIAVLIVAL